MKRQYMIPVTLVLQVECQQLLGVSAQGLDGFGGYGGSTSGKSADSRESSYDLWEDE